MVTPKATEFLALEDDPVAEKVPVTFFTPTAFKNCVGIFTRYRSPRVNVTGKPLVR